MKNGDRLTGTIIKTDAKTLTFKSEYAGQIVLSWDKVDTVTATEQVHVGLKDGQLVVGTVATSGQEFVIDTKAAGQLHVPKDAVTLIRSKDEQAAYEAEIDRYRNPHLTDLWVGFVDLGYTASRGNSDTTAFSLTANANRVTKRDKIGTYFTTVYASNKTNGLSTVTANAIRGGVNYNIDLSKKVFAFASTDLEYDKFQNLDLRFVPAGGGGYHAINRELTHWDLLAGGSLNREFFSNGLRRTSGEIVLGNEFVHNFSKVSSIREKLTFYPNVSDAGSYRVNFDASSVTAIKKWLGWQVSVSDRYLSNPLVGRKSNDILLTTGLRLSFAK